MIGREDPQHQGRSSGRGRTLQGAPPQPFIQGSCRKGLKRSADPRDRLPPEPRHVCGRSRPPSPQPRRRGRRRASPGAGGADALHDRDEARLPGRSVGAAGRRPVGTIPAGEVGEAGAIAQTRWLRPGRPDSCHKATMALTCQCWDQPPRRQPGRAAVAGRAAASGRGRLWACRQFLVPGRVSDARQSGTSCHFSGTPSRRSRRSRSLVSTRGVFTCVSAR